LCEAMFKMLIDTCVWLDVAKDPKQEPVLSVVEELVRRGMLTLLVPRIVIDEFQRNRERVAKKSAKCLSAHFRLIKDAVGRIGGDKRKLRLVLGHLDDVGHKLPIIGGGAANALDRIEKTLLASEILDVSDSAQC
jgi:PIN domain